MTGLEKLIEWMDERWDSPHRRGEPLFKFHNDLLDKARSLLQEERATADEGLREELESLASEDNAYYMHICDKKVAHSSYVSRESLLEILSRHRTVKVESLAELADRKGYVISRIDGKSEGEYKWAIGLMFQDEEGNEGKWKGFEAPTYPAAESAARQYLLALPDAGGGN